MATGVEVHRLMITISASLQQSSNDKGALRPLVVQKNTHVTCFLAFPEPSHGLSKQNKESLLYLLFNHTSSQYYTFKIWNYIPGLIITFCWTRVHQSGFQGTHAPVSLEATEEPKPNNIHSDVMFSAL